MAEVKYCADVFGTLPERFGRMVRMLAIIDDDETATLRTLTDEGGVPTFVERPLYGLLKIPPTDWYFWCETEDFHVVESSCGCGGGLVTYTPMSPGDDLVLVRIPDWIKR